MILNARFMRLLTASLVLAVLFSGCAIHTQKPGAALTAELDSAFRLGDVPFYAQDEYQCGPAALAMMLGAQGQAVSPDELRESVYIPGRKGSLQVEMVATARAKGMVAYPLHRHVDAILTEVAAGHPVLVLQNLRFNWWPQWHFAVVVGYDLERKELILHSGLDEYKRVALPTFDNTWRRGDRWARVLLPPDQIPATAEPVAFVRAVHDLEMTGRHELARQGYQSAADQWPDNLAAGFALANHSLSQNQPELARQGFERLLTQHAGVAAIWYNLGLSLDRTECPAAAIQAAACASALAPDDTRFRTAPGSVQNDSTPAAGDATDCRIPECPVNLSPE